MSRHVSRILWSAVVAGACVVPVGTASAVSVRAAEFPPGTAAASLPMGVAWGDPTIEQGALGDGSDAGSLTAVAIGGGTAVDGQEMTQVDPGQGSACGIAAGLAYCWGSDQTGALGTDSEGSSLVPVPVGGLLAGQRVTDITVGAEHACALSGGVYCWGANDVGQLGDLIEADMSPVPIEVSTNEALAGKTVSAISAGDSHTCVIASGAVYCWGSNEDGQLGNPGVGTWAGTPVAVAPGVLANTTVTAISAGGNHTCALAGGKAYCWGDNFAGETGTGSILSEVATPLAVDASGVLKGLTMTAISSGDHVTCALGLVGGGARRAFCWGLGAAGQLGDGLKKSSAAPVAVITAGPLKDMNLSSISVDRLGGCAVAAGKAYCWGSGSFGRLGNNSLATAPVPVAVAATGPLASRRLLSVRAESYYTTGIAVTPRVFTDVPVSQVFYDDVMWAAGSGVTQGNADNTYAPTANVARQAMAAFLFRFKNPGFATPICDPAKPRMFTDVKTGNPFCGAIEWLVTAQIVQGGGAFGPAQAVTRANMADWIYRAHHPGTTDQGCDGPQIFSDVPMIGCGNILWLAQVGIANGYPDGTFHPGDPVHRDAMAAFLHRAGELDHR